METAVTKYIIRQHYEKLHGKKLDIANKIQNSFGRKIEIADTEHKKLKNLNSPLSV